MFKKLGLLSLAVIAMSSSLAMAKEHEGKGDDGRAGKIVKAPEIDASSAVAGLTLLAGGIAVMLGRRSKRLQVQGE